MGREITSSERKKLRGLAHHIKPVIQLGKGGISDNLIKAAEVALSDHELIKLKFLDFKDTKKELSLELSKKLNSHVVGMVGNTAIFYRENPVEEKRKILL